MFPYLIRFTTPWGGRLQIASYGVMMMLGFLAGLFLLQKRAKNHNIPPEKIFNIAISMLICGVVGARVFYVIQYWESAGFAQNPLNIFRIDKGGLVFYGGGIGGLIGAVAVMLKEKLPVLPSLGLIASVAPLSHAFGRIGCFLNGCCFGRRTDSWIGIRFPRLIEEGTTTDETFNLGEKYISGSLAYLQHLELGIIDKTDKWSAPVHATQLYEVAYNLLIFGILSWWLWKRKRPEELIGLYMITYGMARFVNEIFRVTEPLAMGLSIAQIICIPLALGGAGLLYFQTRK